MRVYAIDCLWSIYFYYSHFRNCLFVSLTWLMQNPLSLSNAFFHIQLDCVRSISKEMIKYKHELQVFPSLKWNIYIYKTRKQKKLGHQLLFPSSIAKKFQEKIVAKKFMEMQEKSFGWPSIFFMETDPTWNSIITLWLTDSLNRPH